jgi:hypothetical protein
VTWATFVTVVVSVLLAVVGYVATYVYNLRLAQRKDRLDHVNRQLSELYGPLVALATAGETTWAGFRRLYRPGVSYWGSQPPPTDEEAAAWRLWMTEVFTPLNERIFEVVTNNAELLVESEMPRPLLDVCAHVAGYRPVVRSWKDGDTSLNTSTSNFDGRQLVEYALTRFRALKLEQRRLIGSSADLAVATQERKVAINGSASGTTVGTGDSGDSGDSGDAY